MKVSEKLRRKGMTSEQLEFYDYWRDNPNVVFIDCPIIKYVDEVHLVTEHQFDAIDFKSAMDRRIDKIAKMGGLLFFYIPNELWDSNNIHDPNTFESIYRYRVRIKDAIKSPHHDEWIREHEGLDWMAKCIDEEIVKKIRENLEDEYQYLLIGSLPN